MYFLYGPDKWGIIRRQNIVQTTTGTTCRQRKIRHTTSKISCNAKYQTVHLSLPTSGSSRFCTIFCYTTCRGQRTPGPTSGTTSIVR
jgi:hypothetical protein